MELYTIKIKNWWSSYFISRIRQTIYITIFGLKIVVSRNKEPLSKEHIQELKYRTNKDASILNKLHRNNTIK